MKLVVVEAVAKKETIARFLGPEYRVEASVGHIRDLPSRATQVRAAKGNVSSSIIGIDVDNGFEPIYVVPRGKMKVVTSLKKALRGAEELILATDEDREGEAISWHIQDLLKPGVPVRRIVFHEITPDAIRKALERPRAIDMKRVRAQEARRALDRIFGFSLSPVLWRKVRPGLSAGRVQSVALRMVVERDELRRAHQANAYWRVGTCFLDDESEPGARVDLVRVGEDRVAGSKDFDTDTGAWLGRKGVVRLDGEAAREIAEWTSSAMPWVVEAIDERATKTRPKPPFTTSTLQQEASRILRMSPRRSMAIAQRLYEGVDLGKGAREGLITYMRTDSTTLSQEALSAAGRCIRSRFGERYYAGPRRYRTKTKRAEEAHEAIRPTDIGRDPKDVAAYLDRDHQRLYDLIWRRAVASQMTDALSDLTTATLKAVRKDGHAAVFSASGRVLRFPGFLKAYGDRRKDEELPSLEVGAKVGGEGAKIALGPVETEEKVTQPRPRYSEASLIRALEAEGIGRPSTYARILMTIQEREYVRKHRGKLLPTWLGLAVNDLLRSNFEGYVDLDFTSRMEDRLDGISSRKDYREFLKSFYEGPTGEEGLAGRIKRVLPKMEFPEVALGAHPETQEKISVRVGRAAPHLVMGSGRDAARTVLPKGLTIDELTMDLAVELLDRARRPIGTHPVFGAPIYARLGPYGPYAQMEREADGETKVVRAKLPADASPLDVSLETATAALDVQMKAEEPLGTDPDSGKPIYLKPGPFGPYLQLGGGGGKGKKPVRASLPKSMDPAAVTFESAVELVRRKVAESTPLGKDPATGKNIYMKHGARGPYLQLGESAFRGPRPRRAPLPPEVKREDLDVTKALEIIASRPSWGNRSPARSLGRHPQSGVEITVRKGRYGPYVTDGDSNATIPKGLDPAKTTLQEACRLLAEKASRPKRTIRKRSRPRGRSVRRAP